MIYEGQVPASKPRIYYGEKVHFLCTRSGVADIRVAMTEMQQVVCLMLDRLEADLATDEVAISMAAFRVLSWLDKSKENLLRKHVAVLGKVLKLPRDGSREFARVAKTLANLVQTCKTQQICVNHRVVWSWVLVPQWRSKFLPGAIEISKELEAMIFFLEREDQHHHTGTQLGRAMPASGCPCWPFRRRQPDCFFVGGGPGWPAERRRPL